MVRRNTNDGDALSLDFSDLIYRSNLRIMENEAFGNYGAKFDIIEYLDRILAPFRDAKYLDDMDSISKTKKPTGNTPQAISNAEKVYAEMLMNKKHEALMCLAYRNGFLGNKKTQAHTGIIEEDNEPVL